MNVKNMLNESLKRMVYYLILEQNRNIIKAGSKRQDKEYKMIYNKWSFQDNENGSQLY